MELCLLPGMSDISIALVPATDILLDALVLLALSS